MILDAWSRRVVGYAISRTIDVRLTLAALNAAIEDRKPPAGCLHHSDRGSQYAAQAYRQALDSHGLVGSMGRRGNPYDNAKAESFMKTMKVEAVYPMAYETVSDVAEDLPSSKTTTPGTGSNQRPDLCPLPGAHSIRGSIFHAGSHSTAERTLPVQGAPGLERIAGVFDLPGDPVDQAAPFERLAQSLAVIRLSAK